MAFWGLKLEPKKWTPFVPPPEEQLRLHISQVRRRRHIHRREKQRQIFTQSALSFFLLTT